MPKRKGVPDHRPTQSAEPVELVEQLTGRPSADLVVIAGNGELWSAGTAGDPAPLQSPFSWSVGVEV